eukprot:779517-Prorocentrum_lima.AAC.1
MVDGGGLQGGNDDGGGDGNDDGEIRVILDGVYMKMAMRMVVVCRVHADDIAGGGDDDDT